MHQRTRGTKLSVFFSLFEKDTHFIIFNFIQYKHTSCINILYSRYISRLSINIFVKKGNTYRIVPFYIFVHRTVYSYATYCAMFIQKNK